MIDSGEPVSIPEDASEQEFERICADLEDELNRLTDKADRICGYSNGA